MSAARCMVCALVLLTARLGHADAEQEAVQTLNAGVDLYEHGDLEAARSAFMRARDLFPQKPNPHRWLGLTDAKLDRCNEAVAELDVFLESVPPRDPRNEQVIGVRDACKQKLAVVVTSPMVTPAPPMVTPAPPMTTSASAPRSRRRYWIAGLVIGGVAVVGLAVGLGVGLGTRGDDKTVYPAVMP